MTKSLIVDSFGRPLSAEPELLLPASAIPEDRKLPPAMSADANLGTRARWRVLLIRAMQSGWEPRNESGQVAAIPVPLHELLDVLDERDALAAMLRAVYHPLELGDEAGTCIGCGCTEERACEGGCAWMDPDRRICSSCTSKIGSEDLHAAAAAAKAARR